MSAICRRRTARCCRTRISGSSTRRSTTGRSASTRSRSAVKDGAKRLILATDPDREGEAISWHLLRASRRSGSALKGVEVERVVFHEVTKPAVLEAMRHGRSLDEHLIDAYQARRALDYLVGFRLSPVLWRKLPKSARRPGGCSRWRCA